MSLTDRSQNPLLLWDRAPASDWAEGYPIGNGRLGGMVLGAPLAEVVSLNHDRLWRSFYAPYPHGTGADMPEMAALGRAGRWDEALALARRTVPREAETLYVNPFVPACDLYLTLPGGRPENYRRSLDLETGIAAVEYDLAGAHFRRELFCPWEAGVLAVHLETSRPGSLTGEFSLSRAPELECRVDGGARGREVSFAAEFEEGKRFAAAARVQTRGGRVTGGKPAYGWEDPLPEKRLGHGYRFDRDQGFQPGRGASLWFDTCDEVLLLMSLVTDEEGTPGAPLESVCAERLDAVAADYAELRRRHVERFRAWMGREALSLTGGPPSGLSTPELAAAAARDDTLLPHLAVRAFHMARYLAVSAGQPQRTGEPPKAPMNLQGLWNRDTRPAWESDYHLDLNMQMCHWGLCALGLPELLEPVLGWLEGLVPQMRRAARDLYGCGGGMLPACCDMANAGAVCTSGYFWTGGLPWMLDVLWPLWEYTGDRRALERLYALLLETERFYADFLYTDEQGRLLPSLSDSPEMPIRSKDGGLRFASSPSSCDLELIHASYTHLLEAGRLLGAEPSRLREWEDRRARLPLPQADATGRLAEWLEPHEAAAPGHRHRSPLIGLCPGDRVEDGDAAYREAALRLIRHRNENETDSSMSFSAAWDAQLYARLGRGGDAARSLAKYLRLHLLGNLLPCLTDWRGLSGPAWFEGVKLFQLEAGMGAAAATLELVFQDRRGILRFLPALPPGWPDGHAAGLPARGGFTVAFSWHGGCFTEGALHSARGGVCRVRKTDGLPALTVREEGGPVPCRFREDAWEFDTRPGHEYRLYGEG